MTADKFAESGMRSGNRPTDEVDIGLILRRMFTG
jgi:hypothetical protein